MAKFWLGVCKGEGAWYKGLVCTVCKRVQRWSGQIDLGVWAFRN